LEHNTARGTLRRDDIGRRLEVQESRMDHATPMRSIALMGARVIPAMAAL
jgi:hypothetical protein